MQENSGKITLNQSSIFYRIFGNINHSNKILIIHHGLSEHSGRYEFLSHYFKDTSFKIYALDARGNGRSTGNRSYVNHFDEYVQDLEAFIDFVKEKESVDKVYLLGHSMGSLVTISYAKKNQNNLKSLVAIGFPAVIVDNSIVFKIKRALAPILSILVPKLELPHDIELSHLTHDEKIIDDFKKDTLRNSSITARLGYEILRISKEIFNDIKKINIPIFILHGKEDKVTSYIGSEKLFHSIGSKNKKIRIYENLYHEILNESLEDREKVIKDLKKWLLEV